MERMMRTLLLAGVLLLAACGADSPSGANETRDNSEEDGSDRSMRADYDGNQQEFAHVLALWNEKSRELSVFLTQHEIEASRHEELRRNAKPESFAEPHVTMFFYFKKGSSTLSLDTLDGHLFSFAKMSAESPVVFSKIGRESIKILSGDARIGATVHIKVEFRGETYKSGGEEVAHIDISRKVTVR